MSKTKKQVRHFRLGRVAAGVMAAAFITASLPLTALAGTTNTPAAGTSFHFNKYLIMDAGDTVPNVTFSFTVVPGDAISADTSDNAVMQVLPGVGTPTVADVTFAPGDTTATAAGSNIDVARTNVQRGGSAGDTVQLDTGEKYATKQATVSFAGITFPEPGIYRYIIRETASADNASAGIIHDTDTDRVLDVYVVDNDAGIPAVEESWTYNNQNYTTEAAAKAAYYAAVIEHVTDPDETWIFDNTPYPNEQEAQAAADANSPITHTDAVPAIPAGLQVASYVLHTDAGNVAIGTSMGSADVQTAGAALVDKTDGFTNEYSSKDLKVEKEVTGNQASRDKYFEFTVKATNVNDDDRFDVSIADDSDASTNDGSADATSGTTASTRTSNQGKTNPQTVTGAALKAGQKFYLQHGQSIVIRGLAPNVSYTVTEDAEDYRSTAKSGDTNTGVIGTIAGNGKLATAGFTNTRNGVVPTGVMMAVAPFAIITLCGCTGAGVIIAGRKKKKKEEG